MRAWAVCCFVLCWLLPCIAQADWVSVQAHAELVWGGDLQGGEPYVYESPSQSGEIIGFEVDIARALARELGVRATFHQNDWSNLVPSLERGDFDVLLKVLREVARGGRDAADTPLTILLVTHEHALARQLADEVWTLAAGAYPGPPPSPMADKKTGNNGRVVANYVAWLRGVNVGGKHSLRMQDLAAMFSAVGCRKVRTYIQSGNVVCTASAQLAEALPAIITREIAAKTGHRVPVMLRSAQQLGAIVSGNLFPGQRCGQ